MLAILNRKKISQLKKNIIIYCNWFSKLFQKMGSNKSITKFFSIFFILIYSFKLNKVVLYLKRLVFLSVISIDINVFKNHYYSSNCCNINSNQYFFLIIFWGSHFQAKSWGARGWPLLHCLGSFLAVLKRSFSVRVWSPSSCKRSITKSFELSLWLLPNTFRRNILVFWYRLTQLCWVATIKEKWLRMPNDKGSWRHRISWIT